tara:strand:- start:2692 stop:2883 length:192 start_codon:yes stop_codon:yes gene_type:complete
MILFFVCVVAFIGGLVIGATFATLGWLKTSGAEIDKIEEFKKAKKEAEYLNEIMRNNNVVGKS